MYSSSEFGIGNKHHYFISNRFPLEKNLKEVKVAKRLSASICDSSKHFQPVLD
jgi:hypothetical protein